MWKFIKKLFYTIAIISIFSIIWGRFFNPIITITQIEGLVKYQKLDRDYISFDEMGKNVKKAVIASEDQNIYRHNGFDFQAIQKAFENSMLGKGTSIVEVVSTCNSGWKLSPADSNTWMVENMFPAYPLGDLKDI